MLRETATTGTSSSTACRASRDGSLPPAASATTRNRSGFARTMSSVCVPIDPVDPSSTMSRRVASVVVAVTREVFHERLRGRFVRLA